MPTWVEYVRHNQRRTQADAAVGDQADAHSIAARTAPRVHRMIERQTIIPTIYERYKRVRSMLRIETQGR